MCRRQVGLFSEKRLVLVHQSTVSLPKSNAQANNFQSLATFKGDLSSLTAPPFLLSPQSMIEYSAFWVEHPALFIAPAYSPSPEIRMLLVLKWFLTTLRQQHNPKDENGRRKKLKPLNPFLGELFIGKWEDAAGTTNLVSEQVSHHPPSTAFHCWNEKHGVRVCWHSA
jgi:hypothetical protein